VYFGPDGERDKQFAALTAALESASQLLDRKNDIFAEAVKMRQTQYRDLNVKVKSRELTFASARAELATLLERGPASPPEQKIDWSAAAAAADALQEKVLAARPKVFE
jgi:hypothetical protein